MHFYVLHAGQVSRKRPLEDSDSDNEVNPKVIRLLPSDTIRKVKFKNFSNVLIYSYNNILLESKKKEDQVHNY